jgi:hypothetical protein
VFLWLVVSGLGIAQGSITSFRTEGNPLVTVNGEGRISGDKLNAGDELCVKKQTPDDKFWFVYEGDLEQLLVLEQSRDCYTVPKLVTLLDRLQNILSTFISNARIVTGSSDFRSLAADSAALYIPTNFSYPFVTVWVQGDTAPYALRLTGSNQTQTFAPATLLQNGASDQIAFEIASEALGKADKLEVLQGNGKRLFCGQIEHSKDLRVNDNLSDAVTELALVGAWQLTPVIYTLLESAHDQRNSTESADAMERLLEEYREFMMRVYSVDSC